jgi:site-specific DNA-methyltransferase (adenine-specific)
MKKAKLMLGDNIESLKKLPDNSIDSVVTDGPYGLTFMNKKWDYNVPSIEFWEQVYRVLKPGGHVLSFGGTRTYHRMVVNIEDAGFEIRDQIQWLYGSGFPKSLNVGKAVDKLEGNEREVVGENPNQIGKYKDSVWAGDTVARGIFRNDIEKKSILTKGESEWEGWGSALKPANEPICLARKPLSEKSIAENVLKWKTGGINVDGCRIGSEIVKTTSGHYTYAKNDGRDIEKREKWINEITKDKIISENNGRFPANIILECICDEVIKGERGEIKKTNRNRISMKNNGYGFGEKVEATDSYNDKGDIHTNPNCPCYLLDEQSGVLNKQAKCKTDNKSGWQNEYVGGNGVNPVERKLYLNDNGGGASRFFYQAKVSKAERNMGLNGFDEKVVVRQGLAGENNNPIHKNSHPTVKPVALMTYLCRLITPPNGIVLDPFMGSGSTGISALLEGFRFCGMEMDPDYFKIAEARINSYEEYRKFIKK